MTPTKRREYTTAESPWREMQHALEKQLFDKVVDRGVAEVINATFPDSCTDLIDLLTAVPAPFCDGTTAYREDEIRSLASDVIDLDGDGLLAVRIVGDLHVSFVVFDFACGPVVGDPTSVRLFERVCDGSGPSGNLRELRHTNWGERDGGYVPLPSRKLIIAAMAALGKWFD